MSSDIDSIGNAIEAQGLSKRYALFSRPIDRLKQLIVGKRRQYHRNFDALTDVSFALPRGGVLGIVGRNGAGKSTLLQLICGTLKPSSGSIRVQGRVAALLELGAGFNPEFSGRENVFMNAAILGLSAASTAACFDDIVQFSGIADFIDQPVKTYSSGMYVRLAFAVAIHVDPDILVIDEALSVGDGDFARRSFDRIMALKAAGKTILFCSHSLYQVEAFCDQVMWLEGGRIRQVGSPGEVVPAYARSLNAITETLPHASTLPEEAERAPAVIAPAGSARLVSVKAQLGTQQGSELRGTAGSNPLVVDFEFVCDPELPIPNLGITIDYNNMVTVASAVSRSDGVTLQVDANGSGRAQLIFDCPSLRKGVFSLSAYLGCEQALHIYDSVIAFASLHIEDEFPEPGLVTMPHRWRILESASPIPQPSARSAPPVSSQPTLRWYAKSDIAMIQALFAESFGQPLSPAHWDWKYGAANDRAGIIAVDDGHALAFYGGTPRSILFFGQAASAIQVGDVMVAPKARGIGVGQGGLFGKMATAFLAERVGYDRPAIIAFGFPSLRALRLGELLGHYQRTDRMMELNWSSKDSARRWRYRTRPWSGNPEAVDTIWAAMATDFKESIIGVRDAAYIRHRYLEHPSWHYEILLTTDRLSGRPWGLLVLRSHPDGLELIDLVAPRVRFATLIAIALRVANRTGKDRLFAWSSEAGSELLIQASASPPEIKPLDIWVPANISTPGPSPASLAGHWWLTGGDVDFR